MCNPAAFYVVSAVIMAAGAAYSVDANNKANEAAQEQAKENIKATNAEAKNVEQAGYVQEDAIRQRTRAMLASQRATFSANNIDMSVGTPLELLGDTAVAGEQDALTVRANAARQAWGLRTQATGYANQASVFAAETKNRNTSTILTTASSIASMGAGMGGGGGGGGNMTVQRQNVPVYNAGVRG
jgi:hypothetical protein